MRPSVGDFVSGRERIDAENELIMAFRLFSLCSFVGWGVDSCPSFVRSEQNMFEETVKERRGRSPGAQAK